MYETVRTCLPGTMMAVESDECEKAFPRVVMVIDMAGFEGPHGISDI